MPEPRADAISGLAVERWPVLFGDAPRRCTGWLHGAPAELGVVLCAPLGAEEQSAHRSVLHLADGLAQRGMRALRFDYPGCGDSEGETVDCTSLQDWVDSVVAAVAWLREVGCTRIALLGLRLGAMVAGMACARARPDWLVLWAPVTDGRRYARELRAMAALGAGAQPDGAWLEVAGHALSRGFVDSVADLDALDWPLAGLRSALLVARDDTAPDLKLRDALQGAGVQFEQRSFAGAAAMFDEPHRAIVPEAALGTLCDWLAARTPKTLDAAPASHVPEEGKAALDGPALRSEHYVERVVRLGHAQRVVGVLCTAATPPAGEAAALMVLLNAGSVHHIGPGRLYVRLARLLAGHGVPSLRIDLPMLGDSLVPGMPGENDCYDDGVVEQVLDLLDDVESRLGLRRQHIAGLCSGAYWALQVAMHPRCRSIEAVAMINPLVVHWGGPSRPTLGRSVAETLRYRKAALQWASWKKLLALRVDWRGMLGALWRHGATSSASTLRGLAQRLGLLRANAVGQGLRRLRRQGVVLGLFVSDGDPGLSLLRQAAPVETSVGLRVGAIELFRQAGADHTFTAEFAKQSLFESLRTFVMRARTL